jgi:hypothetical protein
VLTTPTLRLDVNAADVCSRVASKAAERLRQTMADFRPIVILDVVLGRENECEPIPYVSNIDFVGLLLGVEKKNWPSFFFFTKG